MVNGFLIPIQQINYWQDYFGGELVRIPRLNKRLQAAAEYLMAKTKETPQFIERRDQPFVRYHAVRIEAEIPGVVGVPIPTNRFIFIKTRKIIVVTQ